MNPDTVARWQFGVTTVYHWFFVPVTIALSLLVAVIQTVWVRTGNDMYLRLTKFFGKLFLINFAMGVVTGIVQEFQFGMNWSEYSRFVGDIFGAPLALEALMAFFMESTFLGLWIFGWDRLPKALHLMTIWLAAIGTMLSAVFILAANSFMQHPLGATYNPATNRAEMADFGAVMTNPVMLWTFPHTLAASYMVAGAFIAAVAGWHLAKANSRKTPDEDVAAYRWAAKFGAWVLIAASLAVVITGDEQGKVMEEVQPMKMAAAEALYETQGGPGTQGASFSIFTIGSLDGSREIFAIKVPYVLSFLATGTLDGRVEGINDLKKRYANHEYVEATNPLQTGFSEKLKAMGVESYVPNVPVSYWSFRFMIGLGMLGMLIGMFLLWTLRKGKSPRDSKFWTALMIAMPLLPLFANSFGWIFTEMGRQPWLVFGVLPTAAGVSPGVPQGMVIASLIGYTIIYGVLAVVEVGLMLKYIKLGLPKAEPVSVKTEDEPLSFAY